MILVEVTLDLSAVGFACDALVEMFAFAADITARFVDGCVLFPL